MVGLATAGRELAPSVPLALGAAVALLVFALRPARLRRPPAPLLLLLCLASGAAAGLSVGASARRACSGELAAGDPVAAVGRLAHEAAGGEGPGSARLELQDVRLAAGGRSCRLPRLVVRTRSPVPEGRAGDRIRVRGRWWAWGGGRWPRPPDRHGFLRGRASRVGPEDSRGDGRRPGPLLRLRGAASRRLASRLPDDVVPVASALTLADRSGLSPEVSRRFADAGLAHLLAISGLHVGLVGGGLLWLAGRVTGRRRRRYGLAAGLVVGYVTLIGAPSSAVRAAVLFGGWCATRIRGSPAPIPELLGAAAAVAALADPVAPAGPGYQLSFAGFTGLALGGALATRAVRAARRRGRGPGRRARRGIVAFAGSVGAFLLTAPFAAAHFGRAAPVAVVANFAGVPVTTVGMAGLAGTLALPGPAGALAGDGAAVALRLLMRTAGWFARLPHGHGGVAPPGPVEWTAVVLLAMATAMLAAGVQPLRAAVPAGAAAAAMLGGSALLGAVLGDRALVCQLDVGQGDAATVRTRRGHWIVLDAGPAGRGRDAGIRTLEPFLRDRGARSVSLVVLSHPDLDHVGGLASLLRSRRVDRWLDVGNPAAGRAYGEALDAAVETGVRWLPARTGDRLMVDEVEVLVLAPDGRSDGRPRWSAAPTETNEASLVVRIRVGSSFVYLGTGDAGAAEERRILDRWPADSLRADVLKVGHHGSRTATSGPWLAAVRPEVAVISAGAGNPYGHPHPATLARLRAGAGRVWRTDRDGTLCVEVGPEGRWRIRGEEAWRAGRAEARGGRSPDGAL